MARVLENLPELPAPEKASDAVGTPISLEHLEKMLAHVDPDMEYPGWRDIVAAIRNSPVEDDDDEEKRIELADRWSSGKLGGTTPTRYEGSDPVLRVWHTMPPKAGGVGVGTIFDYARRAGFTGPGTDVASVTETFKGYAPAASVSVPNRSGELQTKPSRRRILTIAEVRALPNPVALVDGLIMEDENIFLFGPPKKGKSLFSLDVGLSIAAGLPVIGHLEVKRPGPVIYMSSEGLTYLKQRVDAWHHARNVTETIPFYYVTDVPQAEGGIEGLTEYVDMARSKLEDRQPSLIIIDTLSRSLGAMDENSAASLNLYEAMTRNLMDEFKCPVLTIAHVGKDKAKQIRGNNAALGNADAYLEFMEADNSRLVKRTGRGDDAPPFTVERVVTSWPGGAGETLRWMPASESKNAVTEAGMADDLLAPFRVREVLEGLGADPNSMITTKVLAQAMFPVKENETTEEYERRLKTRTVQLVRRAKKDFAPKALNLSAFAHVGGDRKPLLWFLIEDDKDEEWAAE